MSSVKEYGLSYLTLEANGTETLARQHSVGMTPILNLPNLFTYIELIAIILLKDRNLVCTYVKF